MHIIILNSHFCELKGQTEFILIIISMEFSYFAYENHTEKRQSSEYFEASHLCVSPSHPSSKDTRSHHFSEVRMSDSGFAEALHHHLLQDLTEGWFDGSSANCNFDNPTKMMVA